MNIFGFFIQIFEYIRLAVNEILGHKLDVLLTVLGIIVGITSVTLILSLGEGVTQLVKNQVAAYQENVFCISYSPDKKKSTNSVSAVKTGGDDNVLGGFMKLIGELTEKNRSDKEASWPLPFDINNYKAQIKRSDMVSDVTYFSRINVDLQYYQKEQKVNVNFCEPNFIHFLKSKVTFGRNFTEFEMANKLPVAVLKMNVSDAASMLKYGGVLGSTVVVRGYTFKVIGVINDKDFEVLLPYKYFSDMATLNDLPQFLVKLKPGDDDAARIKALLEWMKTFVVNGEFFQEDSDIGLFNMVLKYLPKFTLLITVIAGISLVVGGIGIMNSMLSSVVQRTKEIGIKKSIGAQKQTLIIQFMIETVIITGIGGILGISLGVLISTAVLAFFKIPTIFPVLSIVYSIVFTIVTGIASGVVPAVKAAELDPIEALGHS